MLCISTVNFGSSNFIHRCRGEPPDTISRVAEYVCLNTALDEYDIHFLVPKPIQYALAEYDFRFG